MAAFQVCLQVWLATSLLADGLAVAGQVRFHDLIFILKLCATDLGRKSGTEQPEYDLCFCFSNLGYSCECICKEGLQQGCSNSIPSFTGSQFI